MKQLETLNHFGMTRQDALQKGSKYRQRLGQLVENITIADERSKYSHTYIFSPPGLGKTFTVKKHLDESEITYIQVSGNVSMFAFGIQLATIAFLNPLREKIVLFVDDCDVLFLNETNCNTMKNVLEGAKTFTYEKSLSSQWSNLTMLQQEAIEFFREAGKMGFSVPTDNLLFVFTSNFKLPVDDDVRQARAKGHAKSAMMSHKNAIRSRCMVADFDLSNAEQWGWIADVVLNTSCLSSFELSDDMKWSILDFAWYNWPSLTERSIRLVEKMAEIRRQHPFNYQEKWEIDFINN
jgi:hypothetical protein